MKGFTLVEMLVAMAALAVLAAGGFAIAGVSTNFREAVRDQQASTQSLLRMRAALRGDLTQAAARRPRDLNGQKDQAALSAANRGDGVFLSLVRRGWDNPLEQSRASLQYVEYRLHDGQIERLWRRHVDGSPIQAPQILLSGVNDAQLEFYDFDQWTEGWAGAPNRPLPRAVRLTLSLSKGGDLSQVFLLPEASR
ncbi:MAG: type II secretion system minor pseudopilin GspJ [Hyphomonadaceae bacterium]|nr:type II secretion system minor pseudopilin GspJ [Hyphomonadaceae bacterium]